MPSKTAKDDTAGERAANVPTMQQPTTAIPASTKGTEARQAPVDDMALAAPADAVKLGAQCLMFGCRFGQG